MFARKHFLWLALCAAAWSGALSTPARAQCPAKTTVADTLYNADGSLASGRVTIAWPTFLIGTCQVIGGQTTVSVANGAFTVQLYPNTTAVPAGTSFRVTFALRSGRVNTEYWVVPVSATSLPLATVRAPSVPVPAVMFGEAQVTNLIADLAKKVDLPSPCPQGKILESNGSSSPPQVNCVDPSAGSGSQHQVNAANLASNSPVNFQDSASIAFTNPAAGNVQASLADSAVTASKMAASNPSGAQLSGVGDSNIAAAALSPNRVSGTAVTLSRSINTNSPLSGGGDLSSDRTLSCPTCEVSGNKNAPSGYAGLTAGTRLNLAQGQEVWQLADLSDVSGTSGSGSSVPLATITAPGTPHYLGWSGANWVNRQPSFSELSGTATAGQVPSLDGLNGTLTVAKGGTGAGTSQAAINNLSQLNTSGDLLFYDGANSTRLARGANGECLTATPGSIAWGSCAAGGSNHSLLSSTHTDTSPGTVARGDLVTGQGPTPAWSRLALGAANKALLSDGTDAAWTSLTLASAQFASQGSTSQVLHGNAAGNPSWGSVVGADFANQSANQIFAGPVSGGAAAPGFRAMVKADTPSTTVHTDQSNTFTGAITQDLSGITAVKLPSAASPAPSTGGDVRYDTARAATVGGGNQSVPGFFPRVLKLTNCTTEGNCTAASGGNQVDAASGAQGTTETSFASNWSMPANFLFANKAIQACAVFEETTSSSAPTLTIRFKAGTTNLVANTAVAPTNNISNRGFTQCFLLQGTAAAGASVSVEAGYVGIVNQNAGNFLNTVNQPVAVATNAAQTIQISAQWGTATNGNSIRLQQFYVLELY